MNVVTLALEKPELKSSIALLESKTDTLFKYLSFFRSNVHCTVLGLDENGRAVSELIYPFMKDYHHKP